MTHPKRHRPQSLILTLYGDYIIHRGDRIRIGSLIKLLALTGVSEQAVRSTVSRMLRRGWLEKSKTEAGATYRFTNKARALVEEGAPRIFDLHPANEKWDGCWHLVTYSIPETMREARDRFRLELGWLGYGTLSNAVWISPRSRRAQVEKLMDALELRPHVQLFRGELEGFLSPQQVIARGWDLAAVNAQYADFIRRYEGPCREVQEQLAGHGPIDDAEYFRRRLLLIHEYRRFPYLDPHLPHELLPHGWRGQEAVALFARYHDLLAEPANRYFQSVFE